jgi:hypothetical protein
MEDRFIDGLKRAKEVAEGWANARSCDPEQACEHKRTGQGIADAIQRVINMYGGSNEQQHTSS